MKKWTIAVLLFFFSISFSHAGSPVWEVSNGTNTLYLGGTIHVLAQADYPLPKVFDTAYKNAEVLVFETDIGKMQDPEFGRQMMGQMVYSDGNTLQTLVQPSTLSALAEFSSQRGIPIENLIPLKPGMVMVFLTLAELERLGAGGAGVDEFYFKKAMQDRLPIQFFESPIEQIKFLTDIGIGKEDEMIKYILKDIDNLPTLLPIMKHAWRSGDNERLYKESLAPLKNDYPEIYHSLIVKRNLAWMPAIRQMLTTPEVEFILVGALHLAGDQGLIELLRKEGVSVKKY